MTMLCRPDCREHLHAEPSPTAMRALARMVADMVVERIVELQEERRIEAARRRVSCPECGGESDHKFGCKLWTGTP